MTSAIAGMARRHHRRRPAMKRPSCARNFRGSIFQKYVVAFDTLVSASSFLQYPSHARARSLSLSAHTQLERFLIDNRDDYLKYSSRNYTVEQKQFNNMLTERLIALAEQHGYVFDPDDFNFVAIRDRIRCYYKSYVQTARKRGLLLLPITTTTTSDSLPPQETEESTETETPVVVVVDAVEVDAAAEVRE